MVALLGDNAVELNDTTGIGAALFKDQCRRLHPPEELFEVMVEENKKTKIS